MAHSTRARHGLPRTTAQAVAQVGEQVRIARKRRGLTMADMAARMFVGRRTLQRLEQGDPGVSLAVLASALWVLGLEESLGAVAAPEADQVGIFHERQRLPRRVRGSTSDAPDF